jgi:two-component system invasion response regulator UvrY
MLRILIADDHTVVRKGLKQILLEEFPSAEVTETADAATLFMKVLREEWDVVITDISMPDKSGLEVLQQIRRDHPRLPVLILSAHSEDQYAIRALKAGANGYLCKDSASEELVTAIRRILLGKKYITASLAEKLAFQFDLENDRPAHESLSDREFEVMKFLASGKVVSEIASQLCLSVTTISTYRARILAKMNLKTNYDLTRYAMENKLL